MLRPLQNTAFWLRRYVEKFVKAVARLFEPSNSNTRYPKTSMVWLGCDYTQAFMYACAEVAHATKDKEK
jgi:hypothetical protein